MSKVWLVTGAARGLGRAISEAVLAAGDRLVAGVRDPARLADLAERHGDRLLPVALDVTDEAAAVQAVAAARDAFGRIDVLVNNAGYGHTAPFEQMGADDFRDQIETNLFGVINLTRAVLPTMRAQRAGHIFQVSSVGGRSSTAGLSAYQAAKWAVGGFSDVLSKEVAPFGVRVCTLEPGGMRTDWAAQAKRGIDDMLPDYHPSVGKILELLGAYGGHEVGDPARIAALIVELSRRDDVPMRLLLGGDALFVCEQAEKQRADEAAQWRDTTLSTQFPDAKLPDGLQALKGLE
ncbi:short-chain dehydrogenase [Burkholderia aenigmatica]|uniref:SDR family NAD(P)-dependent oxidoreductase n=1 Tax=Burkholderia cepacia complex TaxID=87882 RepID=UPI000F08D312|nr:MULTISPECIES: SDR family NAD(P)-dependent oxidoreductase [Burkholderia cepacia complex]AYQ41740.1 short-chain dehydrogenase/reductase [Burkholderia lata]UKD13544.1 SDR family NAD(P)-dependent oxidoreductase [Burkholderia aenigmatica]VWC89571.1 short-chain dehydrogenase [Burkholderia aenigmatica]